jgi:hypothetical protein
MEKVVGTVYTERDSYGDYNWMIKQSDYDDILFLYADDMDSIQSNTLERSGGTAAIRPYRLTRSSPFPTGSLNEGGYLNLTDKVKSEIQACMEEARDKIQKFGYKRVFYSASEPNGIIGSSTFYVGRDVLEYLTQQIRSLGDEM